MSLPMPVRSTRPAINPVESAATYATQVLAGINSGTSNLPMPSNRFGQQARPASRLPQRTVQGRSEMIRESASRQHQDRLTAFRRDAARRRGPELSMSPQGGAQRGGGGYSGAFTGGRNGLTPQAGQALSQMNAAYRRQFGQDLIVNSGGRSRQEQEHLYRLYQSGRGNLAAPPGTSVHESGRAVDLGGPIMNAGSTQHRWLQANAGRFGWLWTGKNFAQFEPWHWEYRG